MWTEARPGGGGAVRRHRVGTCPAVVGGSATTFGGPAASVGSQSLGQFAPCIACRVTDHLLVENAPNPPPPGLLRRGCPTWGQGSGGEVGLGWARASRMRGIAGLRVPPSAALVPNPVLSGSQAERT
eukprot:CAMPEP_0174349036 /NCGR_PEP_ID=MMETSP0811_2-20130205/5679_1 /TAXON_ID=73025 ORGANISM="Eutreptiella gymnastica-like, Strain CCMP1594" /NCGR_SAMPLE_ID=MMETSP0811_2 /ASSEMBLY_ACC=CAM_ASM_000667 /LENGTH=126 /DNA_ID=CAMNT_0015476123 /DNA_START=245 /DNA_END=621 /DNA_ORIENTATION=+